MLQNSWQSFVARLSAAFDRGSNAKHRRSSPRRALRTEALEQRLVLSSFSVINTNDSGAGSFRQAIIDANANAGADSIEFAIPGSGLHTIQPTSALPPITDSVIIDGYTQAGASENTLADGDNAVLTIELNGSLATLATTGLTITAGNSTVRGLVVNRFTRAGIALSGVNAVNNLVAGNFIGTDVTGSVDLGNAADGVLVTAGAKNNTIGGTTPGERNLISGNNGDGIEIATSTSTGNLIVGNLIGVDSTGTLDLGNNANGIRVAASGTTIGGTSAGAGNVVSGNNSVGISLTGVTGTLIAGNYIGTSASGTADVGNSSDGVQFTSSSGNTIGGSSVAARNIISGNDHRGVLLDGANNIIAGNYIGTDVTGTLVLGNDAEGIDSALTATNNTIGGTSVAARNILSANGGVGVDIRGPNNTVTGNYIGVDVTGSVALGNDRSGIVISGANNTIGGTMAGAGNVVSGNSGAGISVGPTAAGTVIQGNFIGTDATGTADLGNTDDGLATRALNTQIGGTAPEARNIISGNGGSGVVLTGGSASGSAAASGAVVEGNYIGTDVTGTIDLGNDDNGVGVRLGASNNIIGGTAPGARNVISGNDRDGIGLTGNTTTGNLIVGNFIGTDVTGTVAIGNSVSGVEIHGASSTTVGGTTPEARNIISGNAWIGKAAVGIHGPATTSNNVVIGNYIGTDVTGTVDLGNATSGIRVEAGSNNIVGGTAAGAGNLVSGNEGDGIVLQYGVTGILVQGNFIGTDVTGSLDLGNSGDGVVIQNEASGNTIGGTNVAARNIISGNDGNGVLIWGHNSTIPPTNNLVLGNFIGTDVTGSVDLGNSLNGVMITYASNNNTIGGTDAGAGNLIFGNNAAGVAMTQNGTVGNVVRGNSIFGNSGLGIDLDANGITPNDLADGDTGPNLRQNFPGIAVAQTGATTTVSGTLNSTANTSFTLDFYASTVADPSGHGEGQRYLGSATVITDGSGNASFVVTLAAATTATEAISVTATAPSGNTSEFGGHLPTAVAGGPYAVPVGGSVPLNGTGSSDPDLSNTLTYQWDLDGDNLFGETGAGATRGNETGATPTFSAIGLPAFSVVNVTLRVTDTSGLRDEDTASITVGNINPTISQVTNSGPANEGSSVSVTVTATAPATMSYQFDFNNDFVYEVGPQASPVASHVFADDGTYRVNVRVTTSSGGAAVSFTDVIVNNVAPTATDNAYGTNQGAAVSGNVISDAVADSDPAGVNDPLMVTSFTQPANGSVSVAANGSFTYTPATTFSGTDSFTYSINDGDGGTATASVTITVAPPAAGSVTTVIDTCEGGTALLINGTSAGDHIVVELGVTPGTLRININGTITTVATPSGRLIVLGDAGDDNIQIAGSVTNSVWAYGDAGHDRIFGGGGASLLFGGDGNDQLTGGSGRDILIGGQGADKLVGNSNDDVLIAGFTTKDNRAIAGVEEFWCQVMEEWNSANSFADRLANLRGSGTQTANGNNGTSYLLPIVMDDTSADEIDMLQGSSGNDWFIYRAGEDKVVGQTEATN